MVIADDLLFLLLHEGTGKFVTNGADVDLALSGAVLLELSLLERVTINTPNAPGRLSVLPGPPINDEILDGGLKITSAFTGKRPEDALPPLTKNLRVALAPRAADRPDIRPQLRQEMHEVLLQGRPPTQRTAGIIALVRSVDVLHKVIIGKREILNASADRVAGGFWAADAVRNEIRRRDSGTMAAIIPTIT